MADLTPFQLMKIQTEALFTADDHGRLQHIREPGWPESELEAAPRFFMGRTAQGHVWRFRHDLPDELVAELEAICRQEPPMTLSGPEHQPHIAHTVRKLLGEGKESRGPAYILPQPSDPEQIAIARNIVLVTPQNADVLATHFAWLLTPPWTYQDAPVAVAVADGQAVAACWCSRLINGAAECGVRTVESHRGQGHGAAAVALWANVLRETGCLPLYSTSWDNLASQGVARKLGSVQYGEDWSIA